MKYGLTNIFIDQPLSLILSIFLILGVSKLGIIFQTYIKKKYNIEYLSDYFFSPIFGTYILIFFLYPLTLFSLLNYFFFKIIASILIFLGLLFLFEFTKKFSKKKVEKLKKNYLLAISFAIKFTPLLLAFCSATKVAYSDLKRL